ncbi:MAG: PG0541 family transporter-associated protein [Smithella sp.]
MKMFYVIYAEASDEDIVAAFKNSGFKAYTKMCELMGEGEESEPKLGTHYWPGNNNALLLAVSDEKIKPLCELVRKLKVEHPRAGLRAFTFPLEEECV